MKTQKPVLAPPMNPLPELDEEYPVDLSESICIQCDDVGGFWLDGKFKPCPVCGERKDTDEPTV